MYTTVAYCTGHPTPWSGAVASSAPTAWRSLLVANEWNELQTVRRISPVLQVLAVLLLLQVRLSPLLLLLLQLVPGTLWWRKGWESLQPSNFRLHLSRKK